MNVDDRGEDLLTAAEAAIEFRIDQRTLQRWERDQKLKVVRLAGRGRRYRRSDVAALIDAERAADEAAERAAREEAERLAALEREPVRAPTRANARRRALEALHAADVTAAAASLADDAPAFARELVQGVARHRAEIDDAIAQASEHWSIERMPVVDRNVLRLAVYELLHTDAPTGAVVDQAVGLAKMLSTEGSGRFVNGVLGRIARERRPRSATRP